MADDKQKNKVGIKNVAFTRSGTNGAAHRRNAAAKKRQHLANQRARSELYTNFQGEKGGRGGECMQWHQRLNAISQGTI